MFLIYILLLNLVFISPQTFTSSNLVPEYYKKCVFSLFSQLEVKKVRKLRSKPKD